MIVALYVVRAGVCRCVVYLWCVAVFVLCCCVCVCACVRVCVVDGMRCVQSVRSAFSHCVSPGYFCPEGSSQEHPCPVGMYNPLPVQASNASCLLCPAQSFGHLTGQPACLPCPASATSDAGAQTCECTGLYRFFQMSDSMCVCSPNYEFIDADGVVKSENDGSTDCQPINYPRCTGSASSRDASGNCVTPNCNDVSRCDSGRGTWNPDMGLCNCVIEEPLEVRRPEY